MRIPTLTSCPIIISIALIMGVTPGHAADPLRYAAESGADVRILVEQVGPDAILEGLEAYLVDPTQPTHAWALTQVTKHFPDHAGPHVDRALGATETHPAVTIAAVRAVGTLGLRAHAGRIEDLAGAGSPQDLRLAAIGSLGGLDPDRPAVLTSLMMDDPDPAIRARAAASVGHLGWAEQADRLAHLMRHDPEESVRDRAAWALGAAGGEVAHDHLVTYLEEHRAGPDLVVYQAIDALARFGPRTIGEIAPFVTMLPDENFVERTVRALATMMKITPPGPARIALEVCRDRLTAGVQTRSLREELFDTALGFSERLDVKNDPEDRARREDLVLIGLGIDDHAVRGSAVSAVPQVFGPDQMRERVLPRIRADDAQTRVEVLMQIAGASPADQAGAVFEEVLAEWDALPVTAHLTRYQILLDLKEFPAAQDRVRELAIRVLDSGDRAGVMCAALQVLGTRPPTPRDPTLSEFVARFLDHEDPHVASTAAWCLEAFEK